MLLTNVPAWCLNEMGQSDGLEMRFIQIANTHCLKYSIPVQLRGEGKQPFY
jgi:hypothetical protein